jgi:hypothetical protein
VYVIVKYTLSNIKGWKKMNRDIGRPRRTSDIEAGAGSCPEVIMIIAMMTSK